MLDVVLEAHTWLTLRSAYHVSILVVLDVVLEAEGTRQTNETARSFNPCCAGCSSGRST